MLQINVFQDECGKHRFSRTAHVRGLSTASVCPGIFSVGNAIANHVGKDVSALISPGSMSEALTPLKASSQACCWEFILSIFFPPRNWSSAASLSLRKLLAYI